MFNNFSTFTTIFNDTKKHLKYLFLSLFFTIFLFIFSNLFPMIDYFVKIYKFSLTFNRRKIAIFIFVFFFILFLFYWNKTFYESTPNFLTLITMSILLRINIKVILKYGTNYIVKIIGFSQNILGEEHIFKLAIRFFLHSLSFFLISIIFFYLKVILLDNLCLGYMDLVKIIYLISVVSNYSFILFTLFNIFAFYIIIHKLLLKVPFKYIFIIPIIFIGIKFLILITLCKIDIKILDIAISLIYALSLSIVIFLIFIILPLFWRKLFTLKYGLPIFLRISINFTTLDFSDVVTVDYPVGILSMDDPGFENMHQISILWVNHILSIDGPYARLGIQPEFTKIQLLSGAFFLALITAYWDLENSELEQIEIIVHLLNIIGIPVGTLEIPSIYEQANNYRYLLDFMVTLYNTLNPEDPFNLDTNIPEGNRINFFMHIITNFRSFIPGLTISEYNEVWSGIITYTESLITSVDENFQDEDRGIPVIPRTNPIPVVVGSFLVLCVASTLRVFVTGDLVEVPVHALVPDYYNEALDAVINEMLD
jgi:hypothetical protein